MKRPILFAAFSLTFVLLLGFAMTAQASGPAQVTQYSTPTPGPNGQIIYKVQPGDTCTRISLLTGVPVDTLRALNRLDTNCALTAGQDLLIGMGGPSGDAQATAGPAGTPTPLPPTPTAIPGAADVCVTLYEDVNGDALRQETETIVSGGAISITGTSGQYSQTATTVAGIDPACFSKVPIGTYNISVAAPEGYNATTLLNYTLEIKQGDVKVGEIKPGDRVYVDFGVQPALKAPVANPTETAPGGDANILGMVGIGLLVAGVGLAIFAGLTYGRKPKYM